MKKWENSNNVTTLYNDSELFVNKTNKFIKLSDKDNLTREEKNSMSNLIDNKDILIKPADKGGATVIVNKSNYIFEAKRQLNNPKYYVKLDRPIYTENIPKIKNILTTMQNEKFISKNQFDYLTGPANIRNRTFYLLPKIHKKKETWPQPDLMPEGRPIVSDIDSETYRVSEYIDHYLNPLATKHATYVKNTYDFIDKIRDATVNTDYLLVTGDITSLYTNMNIDRSLDCVKRAFELNKDNHRPDKHILDLLELSLKYNDFEFAGEFYLQTMGTAMGKRFAPALANLYLLDFDNAAINDFKTKPILFFRYLDDIFFLWPGDVQSLKEYENFLNSLIPDIKVTLEFDKNTINFLDTTIYKQDNKLNTRVYFKPTDTHQLLHRTSFHPQHTFKGILKSQFIRFKRISSTKSDYLKTSKILMASLVKRGYGNTFMRKLLYEVWFNYDIKPKDKTNNSNSNIIPIVLDYCSFGKELGLKYRESIKDNDHFKDSKTLLAFRNHKNLKQILIRNKIECTNHIKGAFRGCGVNKCKTCSSHSRDTDSFHSNSVNKKFQIKHNISCDSSNLIYLINCNKCKKQYIGETGRTLRERVTDHRSAIKLKKNTPIGLHFNSPLHSILDLSIIGIELINKDKESQVNRKQREKFWQRNLGTVYPRGLNGMPLT